MAKNKAIVLSVIASLTLMLLLIGATYAYFQAKTDSGSPANVKVQTYTVDVLSFETGDPLSFTIDQDNFAKDQDSLSASTFAGAILSANNKTNTATDHYYMYLNISNNSFIYTQDENTPEMILTITSASGTPLTSIDGLTYKEVTDNKGTKISGFDITTKNGLIPLLSNKEISANPKTEEKWNVTITFVNYNLDQSKNAGKDFTAKLIIQKEKIKETVATVCSSGQTLSSCIIAMNGKDNTLYYHDANLENGAGDNSYRYAGGDYQLTNKATEKGINIIHYYTTEMSDDLVKFYCDEEESSVGNGCNGTFYYTLQYETPKNKYSTYNEALEKAVEDGYLTKDNIKNFVCFGTDKTPCPTENLYRIIGVFNSNYHGINDKSLVKLVKYNSASSDLLGTNGDYYGNITPTRSEYKEQGNEALSGYYWNYKATDSATNTWSTSLLNKTNLNTNYLNNIGTIWSNKIATTTWKVGGNTPKKIKDVVPSVAYQNEVVNPEPGSTSTTDEINYNAKVGLMYLTDFAFADAPTYWTTTMGGFKYDDNWLNRGTIIWPITRNPYSADVVYWIHDWLVSSTETSKPFLIYPTFLLTSTTTYASGTGTMSDPIIIN